MKHRKRVLGIVGLLTLVVVVVSWLLFPEWRGDPRYLLVLTVTAIGGVVAFLQNLASLLKDTQPQNPEPQGKQGEGPAPGSGPEVSIHVNDNDGTVIGVQNVHNYPAPPRLLPLQRPPRAENFTGRELELAWVQERLQPGRVITICGPGGMGKTALAAEAVWALAPDETLPERFPDGLLWHSFYVQRQIATACESFALAYGEELKPNPYEAARRALAGRKALLLLDGAEAADDLPALLELCASCAVLVTTRRRQDAPGERLDLEPLPPEEALVLFRSWAGAAAGEDTQGERLCSLVGRLPLALRLAGRYLAASGLGLGPYLEWLEASPLEALDLGQRQGESVPLLLRLSLEAVSETARRVLGAAGALAPAPFVLESVRAALGLEHHPTLRAVGELVDYGLLQARDGRYETGHALVRLFARREMPLDEDGFLRLAGFYNSLARQERAHGAAGFARLDPERAHALEILRECGERAQWRAGLDLAWALDGYLDLSGRWTERVTALGVMLTSARALRDRRNEGAALTHLGNAYSDLGDPRRAIEYHERAW